MTVRTDSDEIVSGIRDFENRKTVCSSLAEVITFLTEARRDRLSPGSVARKFNCIYLYKEFPTVKSEFEIFPSSMVVVIIHGLKCAIFMGHDNFTQVIYSRNIYIFFSFGNCRYEKVIFRMSEITKNLQLY